MFGCIGKTYWWALGFMIMQSAAEYYEDLRVGQTFKSGLGRTVLEEDNVWFSLLTLNTNQIHFNLEYAQKHYSDPPFEGRLIVNGVFTLGLVIGLSVSSMGVNGVMLGLEDVRFVRPVFAGDTIYAEVEVAEMRESTSRRGFGVVKLRTRGYNQRGETVVEFVRVVLVPMRSQGR